MANLAIKGHSTRGKEVIEILEMLGGVNKHHRMGNIPSWCYYIGHLAYIYGNNDVLNEYLVFTLEEFQEKFPYKVGDKVSSKYLKNYEVSKMEWESVNNRVIYKLQGMGWYSADELQPYKEEVMAKANKAVFDANTQCCDITNRLIKEETMESKPNLLQQLKEYFDNTPRDVLEKEWHEYDKYNEIGPTVDEYLKCVKKYRQSNQYPKTYEECCDVLNIDISRTIEHSEDCPFYKDITCYEYDLLSRLAYLRKLFVCRDAYWTIAGEQMGLGKPWKPDFTINNEERYGIYTIANRVEKDFCGVGDVNMILTFPTEEMRDAFYENFKDLIEQCKELL